MTTTELDNLAAEIAATMTTDHPDYAILAARIAISNLHKETKKHFSGKILYLANYLCSKFQIHIYNIYFLLFLAVVSDLYNIVNPYTNKRSPMISEFHYNIIMKNKDRLDSAIVYDRDFKYNYFGFKTLERSYLLKINNKVFFMYNL